ncbi:MAG TPA: alanine dehydrogenase [Anaerolineales bacterium]|nr:alanine dehydrogenase [Anaerolineales bacterium]
MNISIPKERRPAEYRAGLTPTGVALLTEDGHTCLVERGTGLGVGFSDDDYAAAGAQIVYTGEEVYARGDVILKVARPTLEEIEWLIPEQTLVGYLHLPSAHLNKIQRLLDKRITTISYEQLQRADGTRPVIKPLSQIGGQMAAQTAAHILQNNAGGKGVLLGGVPGVPPAEVVIIGAGVVGEYAARGFLGMGAQVTLLDNDLDRLQSLAATLPGRVVTLVAHTFNIERACAFADVVVGAVHNAHERTPVIIMREVVQKMRNGAVLLDLSIDEGGCAETSRPTTHDNPTYIEEGVIHCCIPNLSAVVARTATHAFLNAAWPFIQQIARHGVREAVAMDPVLATGVYMDQGKIQDQAHLRIGELI